MSYYFKKFVILKQAPAGNGFNCAIKFECDNFTTSIKGQILSNGSIEDKYYLLAKIGEEKTCKLELLGGKIDFDLKGNAESGFVIAILKCDLKTPVLYASSDNDFDLTKLLSDVESDAPTSVYDDEIIATENYYEGDNFDRQNVYIVDNDRSCENKNSTPKTEEESRTVLHEKFDDDRQTFFEKIKERLDEILSSHDSDDSLCALIPNSKFAKINYDGERFYSVGKIYKNQTPKYVCYAVYGSYKNAPLELKNYCSFLPLNPFYPLGDGYYVIFQCATTGEIVLKN